MKLIILDFDGTLADTAGVIIKTMQATIRELGLPERTDGQCAAMIGLRLVEIPAALYPECTIDGDLYAQTYRRLFHIFNTDDAVKLYPHVLETLNELKSEETALEVEFERRISYSNIELQAAELGMSKCSKDQVKYIRVNDKDAALVDENIVVSENE